MASEHGRLDPPTDQHVVRRPVLRQALLDSRARVVVVVGASGSGKTTLLNDACGIARANGVLVCGPAQIYFSDHLATVILGMFGDAVADVIQQQGMSAGVASRLQAATARLIDQKGREIVVAAGREILACVRSRLGPEAGEALRVAWTALAETDAESLSARLDRVSQPQVREMVVEFAKEVQDLSADRRIVLGFDRCDRLSEDGFRLLADLVELMPDGMTIWAASQSSRP